MGGDEEREVGGEPGVEEGGEGLEVWVAGSLDGAEEELVEEGVVVGSTCTLLIELCIWVAGGQWGKEWRREKSETTRWMRISSLIG